MNNQRVGVARLHCFLQIPRVDCEESISENWRIHHDCLNFAIALTSTAKMIVEGLIEGIIEESQLISAQSQLDIGDNTLDHSILNRLKTDGMDGTGQALFPDLDQLYSLLEQAR